MLFIPKKLNAKLSGKQEVLASSYNVSMNFTGNVQSKYHASTTTKKLPMKTEY